MRHHVFAAAFIALVMFVALLALTGELQAAPVRSNGTALLASWPEIELPSSPPDQRIASQPPKPLVTSPLASITTTNAHTAHLPLITKTDLQLYGSVTFHGVPISDVVITLYKCCIFVSPGCCWIQIQITTTNANGVYNFTGVPGMDEAEGST